MLNVNNSADYNYQRVCELQRLLGGHLPPGGDCAATGGMQPAFLPPAKPLALADVFAAMRVHYDGQSPARQRMGWHQRGQADRWRYWHAYLEAATAGLHCKQRRAFNWGLPGFSHAAAATLPLAWLPAAGTPHDPYLHQNPEEPWRPVAVLRTAMAHGGWRLTKHNNLVRLQ